MTISRRDFLNGAALTIGVGLTPMKLLLAAPSGKYYPPALTGMRGNHPGSFDVAHQMGWEKKAFAIDDLKIEEEYDLVVVGGGVSGLSAAWFYRQKVPNARILIVENHDDFGGHAKRNEFKAGGRMILGYGGSESLQSPKALFSKEVKGLLQDLNVKTERFESAFDRRFYPELGLSRGVFFDQESFGQNKLVTGDPTPLLDDDLPKDKLNARDWKSFLADFPLPESDRQALLSFYTTPSDYLARMDVKDRAGYLAKTSYLDFIRKDAGLSKDAAKYFLSRTNDYLALSIDAVSAYDAFTLGFPGFGALQLDSSEAGEEGMEEPYIYHFPDGNASVARMLVRKLIPGTAPGSTMEDILTSGLDYSRLDLPNNSVRIRLNSTVVSVKNQGGGVDVGYSRGGQLHRLRSKHCVMACYNMMIPYLLRDLSSEQAHALSQNVKFPLVYTKVVLRNWTSFAKLGVHQVYCPSQPYSVVKLDYPVDLGSYHHPRDPNQPIGLQMVYAPTTPDSGMDARTQARIGRSKLYSMTFEQMEATIREQLQAMLAPGGFNHEKDILAITVNRWSHGYSYYANSLFDDESDSEQLKVLARQKVGNVTIANADAAWDAYLHAAIDQASRAVGELVMDKVSVTGTPSVIGTIAT